MTRTAPDGSPAAPSISARHRALLQAVAAGRCRITLSRAPDLLVDDRYSCDQQAARSLAAAGLIRPVVSEGQPGELVAAVLTSAGRAVLR
jgi:hypothetical protein